MWLRAFAFSAIAYVLAVVPALDAIAETSLAKFSGHNSGQTQEFEVKGPWLLDFEVTSEFPDLATTVIRLEDATDRTVGVVADFAGTGRGLKLFRESGTYRLSITGENADWQIEISEISEDWAARLEQMSASGRSGAGHPGTQQQVAADAFDGWRVADDGSLILIGTGAMSFRVSFGPGGCSKLAGAKTLSFVTPGNGPQTVYDSILFDDGTRCYFDKVTWIPR